MPSAAPRGTRRATRLSTTGLTAAAVASDSAARRAPSRSRQRTSTPASVARAAAACSATRFMPPASCRPLFRRVRRGQPLLQIVRNRRERLRNLRLLVDPFDGWPALPELSHFDGNLPGLVGEQSRAILRLRLRRRQRVLSADEALEQHLQDGDRRDGQEGAWNSADEAKGRDREQPRKRADPDRPTHHARSDDVALDEI